MNKPTKEELYGPLNFAHCHELVVEETYDGCVLKCYYTYEPGQKSSNPYLIPDDDPEVEICALTIADPIGHEIRIETFDFVAGWDLDWLTDKIYEDIRENTP